MPNSFFYACTAGVRDGIARCRKQFGKCDIHRNYALWSLAPRPDIVLVKVNLSKTWEKRFGDAGIPCSMREYERAVQLGQAHKAQAGSLGRSPHAIREGSGREQRPTPEAFDSGTPVFDKKGLVDRHIDIYLLVDELQHAGFILTGAHRLVRHHKPPARLVMEFSKPNSGKEQLGERFPWRLFRELVSTSFDQVDVWTNPRNADGIVTHTVNCGRRNDGASPRLTLHFEGGDWGAEEIPETTAAQATTPVAPKAQQA